MQISHNGLEFLKGMEGFRSEAYKDSIGKWTIGFGTTTVDGKPVEMGMVCARAQAELWLEKDLAPVQTAINQNVKVKITQGMFDALCSFAYNLGAYALVHSTLMKLLNETKYTHAADQFGRWVHAGGVVVLGLVKRRALERAMFEGK